MAGEQCDGCGFVWDEVTRPKYLDMMKKVCDDICSEIARQSSNWIVRPSQDRWSTREYACHLRDVLLSLRERVILAAVTDKPTGTALYRDDRVHIGLYRTDEMVEVMTEIAAAGALLARTIQSLPEGFESRTMIYSAQTPMEVPIIWVAAQGLHEAVHHFGDIRENARLLDIA